MRINIIFYEFLYHADICPLQGLEVKSFKVEKIAGV